MENHINVMLNTDDHKIQSTFIQSESYTGSLPGYYFGTGQLGLGYYYDKSNPNSSFSSITNHPNNNKKRKYEGVQAPDEAELINTDICDENENAAEVNNNDTAFTADSLQQVHRIHMKFIALQFLYIVGLIIVRKKDNKKPKNANEICRRT